MGFVLNNQFYSNYTNFHTNDRDSSLIFFRTVTLCILCTHCTLILLQCCLEAQESMKYLIGNTTKHSPHTSMDKNLPD